jgi:hypothetical protein
MGTVRAIEPNESLLGCSKRRLMGEEEQQSFYAPSVEAGN